MAKTLKVRQTKSSIARLPSHKATLTGLGLRRIGHVRELEDTPAVRGMINKVNYMVEIVEE
ncbi:50S ribosomal protein L30 [Bowmanella pacifica]|uniref:Large ribosomal subunit protein uL30 n=1 Tax=Bowmanella pacifica TaxID=502051 RepID=A0A918DKH9_9ALTE|nr:50S ribosomal protein L30 [Bowmanella pacifica]GGO70958.1 50S ribosomal protein L30 [Bowmanella pacifica]